MLEQIEKIAERIESRAENIERLTSSAKKRSSYIHETDKQQTHSRYTKVLEK